MNQPYVPNIMELDKLPLDKDKISEYLPKFKDGAIIGIKYTDCNFESPSKMINYCCNCGISRMVITGEYKDLEALLLEYMKTDRNINILNFNEIIVTLLFKGDDRVSYVDDKAKELIESIREKYKDMIEEIHSYFFSMHKIISSIITPEDEELKNTIENLEPIKLATGISHNIINIRNATQFTRYIYHLDEVMKLEDIKKYKEFDMPVFSGSTPISYMLNTYLPYKLIYMHNQMARDPEWAKEMFEKSRELMEEEE